MPVHPIQLTLVQGLIAGITVNAVAGFGEELGWRGFLVREFREMHFLRASLIIGFIWGIWHTPIILMGHNYPQHPEIGVLMMTIFCILLTPLFIYVTIKAKSVIAAAIIHGTLNATAGISIMLTSGGNDLTTGLTGLAGFITLIFILILLYIYDSKITKEKILTGKIIDHL
jgi:membrane protease YdiL (CAAX protease family)